MVSYAYPNVNKHIYSQVPQFRLDIQSNLPIPSERVSSLGNNNNAMIQSGSRMSAPPPYSEEDPVQQYVLAPCTSSNTKSTSEVIKCKMTKPSLLLEVAVGYRLAKTITDKRQQRHQARLERVHDAWAKLGLNTRLIASQGGQLPPHFWNPPQCSVEEMNAALAKLLP